MTGFRQIAAVLAVVVGIGGSALAQSSSWPGARGRNENGSAAGRRPGAPAETRTETRAETGSEAGTETAGQARDPQFKENVVVSASKTEQQIVDAAATMTVIGQKELSVAPTNNYADLLRAVPGVNITQISARDVNVNTRGATSSLATAQLAVVDGRSIYQDFFGFTMWEFMPSNLDEIKRIEVIRGPASAVWGANALNGVVNVITKSPREMLGTSVTFGAGSMSREVNDNNADSASIFYVAAPTRRRSTIAGPTSCHSARTCRTRSRVRPASSRTVERRAIRTTRTTARSSRRWMFVSTTTLPIPARSSSSPPVWPARTE
jgi:outer membrane receptor protein involved in Fe transport